MINYNIIVFLFLIIHTFQEFQNNVVFCTQLYKHQIEKKMPSVTIIKIFLFLRNNNLIFFETFKIQ